MNTQFTVEEILLRYKEMLKFITNWEGGNQIKSMSLEKESQSWIMLRVGGDTGIRHPHLPGGQVGRSRLSEE